MVTSASLTTKADKYTPGQELFCLLVFQGESQINAYREAFPASQKWNANSVYCEASKLASMPKVAQRLSELRQKAEDAAIGTVVERKKKLTEIYRADLTDFIDSDGKITLKRCAALGEIVIEPDGRKRLKLRDPVGAIAEHNRMERIGQPDTVVNVANDNRSITIVVKSEDGRVALQHLQTGKLPHPDALRQATEGMDALGGS